MNPEVRFDVLIEIPLPSDDLKDQGFDLKIFVTEGVADKVPRLMKDLAREFDL